MRTAKRLIGVSITATILACCSNLNEREKTNPLIHKWNIIEVRTKDTILKAPGLTLYDFLADNSYTLTLHESDTAIKSYKGKYNFKREKSLLITDYIINGQAQHDEAQVILLTAVGLQLVDINTKDTIVFKAYSK